MKRYILLILFVGSTCSISAPIPSGYQAIDSVPVVSPVSTPVKNLTIHPPFANWLEAEFKRSAPVNVIDKHGAKASGAVYRQAGTISKGPIVRFLVGAAKYAKGKGPYLTAAAFVIPWLLDEGLEQDDNGAWFERPVEGSVTWVLSKKPVAGTFEQQCAILNLGCVIVATVPPNSPPPTALIDAACDAYTPPKYKEIGQSAMYGSHRWVS